MQVLSSELGDALPNSPILFCDWGSRAPGRRMACSSLDRLEARRCLGPNALMKRRRAWRRQLPRFVSFCFLLITCYSYSFIQTGHAYEEFVILASFPEARKNYTL